MDILVDAWSERLPLFTDRLSLVAIAADDIATLAELGNAFEIAKNTSRVPHPLTSESVAAWLQAQGRSERALKICRRDDGHILGIVSLAGLETGRGELGYWLGRDHWGNGLATEAAQAIIDFGFDGLDLGEIEAACRVTNPASRRVIEKCGFQPRGHGLMHSVAVGGTVAIERYALDRKTWCSLKKWARS
ncbi:GNAT family N-acetyltransferase [Amorphus sp. 3PC139-8]|uniref:GNAT family N-acetyltransferase n=1 Tax=Amorphus sp. 3PC139-8 TaxID=2735676 RepID=UPI00345DADF1